ncbi:PdxA family dehydrogenase [Opitutus terrae]|uniref:4-hydroxythreonine-4-phosphate dehydrogenase n=1 Tax=Opitutus terrae (strain DSM 11246 / JCM 15787 / PB90-1) TaxID=452637 RepID=B1ZQS3_OPITP|nr:4-hydroxythreonine-4-phosphate dehydrogenase PdxA [Opitutus terrae]ACB77824.1 4-hydroxythreonine-4-phosphate dehydrogenase [Opitutus terrae PB90-1]
MSKLPNTTKLALTCGDPAGVGPEVIASWLASPAAVSQDVVVIGPPRWLESLPAGVRKIAVGLEDFSATPGAPDADGALVAWAAIERAAEGCRQGEFCGVVTGPISKERLAKIGYPFPGQTEFFAARWGGEPVMAFAGGRLRVVLATWHIPLHEVGGRLGPHLLHRAAQAATEIARIDCRAGAPVHAAIGANAVNDRWGQGIPPDKPRIGVCGLNPHAGEGGLLGYEERDFIDPALDHLRTEFAGLSRCQPADTIFARALQGEFDVVIALYHDQGLAPLKTIDFDESVNVTLGLPFVRTSPDHGTGFGIAGKGVARATSFANAVTVARQLIAARAEP